MNLKKGFFRLTLVLSISIGIISAFVMMEREPYTRFKVKRSGEGVKELTIILLWYGGRDPDIFDFVEAFNQAETTNKRVIKGFIDSLAIVRAEKERKWGDIPDQPTKEDLSWLPDQPAPKKKKIIDPLEVGKPKASFAILEKTAPTIKWNRFFLILGIGFISVWLVYVFIRWVIVAFIIGGFRHKANS